MLIEELKNIKESKKDLKKFGLTIGIALLLISALLFYLEKESYIYFAAGSGFFILAGLTFPIILKPFNKLWMTFAILLGWFMSRVILTILFYLILTPIGLIAKIFGKKFLDLQFKSSQKTYWIKREIEKEKIDYERQF